MGFQVVSGETQCSEEVGLLTFHIHCSKPLRLVLKCLCASESPCRLVKTQLTPSPEGLIQ